LRAKVVFTYTQISPPSWIFSRAQPFDHLMLQKQLRTTKHFFPT
jgi:hypothetical protein